MIVEYTARQTEVSPAIRKLVEKKLKKLGKVLRLTRVHVILTEQKHRQIAEVSVHSPHLDLTASEQSHDLAASVSNVLDKLARQAQRQQGKRQERKRRSPPRAAAAGRDAARAAASGDGPRVIRSRRFVAKPMTVDEAVLEVNANAEGVLVFRDAASERVTVLYRRKDGNLGLIEPEA